MIHRTVFGMPVTGPDPAVAPEKTPAWTYPKTVRGDRDLQGKWPSADTIHYKATVDDPTIFTRLRRVPLPRRRNPDYRIYEYASDAGNYALLNFIRGSQFPSGAEAKTVTVEIPRSPGLNLSVVGVVRGRSPLAQEVTVCVES